MNADSPVTQGPLGLFGGTFDPIHLGHLRTAYELLRALKLQELRFLPTGNPPEMDFRLYSSRASGVIFHSSVGSFVPQPYQPERSLLLKSAVNPGGGVLLAARSGRASAARMR